MSDAAKRAEVADMYPGPRWKRRVAQMTDAQIYAIWAKKQAQNSKPEDEHTDEADSDWPF